MAKMARNLSFLLLIASFSLSIAVLNRPKLGTSSHRLDAERLIRSLNLTPRDADADSGKVSNNLAGGRIVEWRFALPGLSVTPEELGHHAGYFKLPHTYDGRMFYFFFESRQSKQQDPVVIWLTGGPGCSGEVAVFYENGPFTIADNLSVAWNEFGWDQASNLIYVDQPIGTGFSYSSDERDIRHDEQGVSNDLYDFLQAFFTKHPELATNDLYITGESYAGHYIPAFASRIHQGNKAKEGIHINLKGFAIGNGLTEPTIQYGAYTDYALANGLIEKADYDRINEKWPACESAIKLCGTSPATCLAANDICDLVYNSILEVAGNINYYDIRKECEGELCYDFGNMERFLNLKSVRDALGVGDIEFVSCSPSVYDAMLADMMKNWEVGIPALLEDGIRVLIYAGEYDLICNWLGNSRWVHAMEWSGQRGFVSSPDVPFTVDSAEAGVLKTHGPLSFLKVKNAGHMVPMDQPKAALEMLKRWVQGELAERASGLILDAPM